MTVGNHLGQKQCTVNFNITKTQDGYQFDSTTLKPGKWDYDSIVNGLVSEVYPNDKMQAIINNYLLEPEDAEIKAEFDEMQNWRKEAKALAKRLLEEYN